MGETAVGAEVPAAAAPAVHDANGFCAVEAVNIEDHGMAVAPVRAEQQLRNPITVKIAQQPAGRLVVVVHGQKIVAEVGLYITCASGSEIADIRHQLIIRSRVSGHRILLSNLVVNIDCSAISTRHYFEII